MTATKHASLSCREPLVSVIDLLEQRRLLAAVSMDPGAVYQTIQGWGSAAVYPNDKVTIAQAGAIMRDAGMNVVRITAGPDDYTYTVGGNMRTPVPISANLDENVARFYPGGTAQTDLIDWLQANAFEPDRIKMIGALWSPPHWMKITTGRLMQWDFNGAQSAYDPIIPWGDYGHNTGGGRVNPAMWTDWARYVLSTVKVFEQRAGLPMHAFSFQNEPNVPATYNSCTFPYVANNVSNPSAGFTDNHWEIYGDGLQALANERALHPEITTKFFGPELSQLGGGASNPYNLPSYNSVRQNLISRGLLDDLGGYATHEYTYPADSAAMWDAWYNGSAHAANIISGGTSNVLGWLWPIPGIGGDNKEIWQTEAEGEDQTWTKDGAMGFGLKIYNALVFGNASGYVSWNLTGYNSTDQWGVVHLNDINNPTNSYKFDAFKQFSRWVRPGAQRIKAVFENGKPSIGGAHELDTYNGLNVSAFNHAQDKRLTMVFVNMKSGSESTTITIPAGLNVAAFQVYQTSGTQKYVQLADLRPSSGQITLTVPASSIVTITGAYGAPVLPAGWNSADIGSPATGGGAGASGGTFTVTGGGTDIWNTSDQFHFAYTDLSGNGSIIARVTGMQNTNTWAKAGVMFRGSTAANATFADVVATPGQGVSFQWRSSTGGNCGFTQVWGIAAPVWVRLERTDDNFSGYYATTTAAPGSADWIQIGSPVAIAMPALIKTGLAVTSHNASVSCTATFTDVSVADSTPEVTLATIDDGAAQRSMVRSVKVAFSEPVQLGTDAIRIRFSNGSTIPGAAIAVSNPAGDGRTYTLAFSGTGVLGGSLPDGVYDLIVDGAAVEDLSGNAMVGSYTQRFHRLFGDLNGDRRVNLVDYTRMRMTLGKSAGQALFNDALDCEGGGLVNVADLAQFRKRFGMRYTY